MGEEADLGFACPRSREETARVGFVVVVAYVACNRLGATLRTMGPAGLLDLPLPLLLLLLLLLLSLPPYHEHYRIPLTFTYLSLPFFFFFLLLFLSHLIFLTSLVVVSHA